MAREIFKRCTTITIAALILASCSGGTKSAGPAAEEHMTDAETQALSPRAAITDYARLLFIERKPSEAFAKYYAPDLIQHDPWIADGSGGDDDFLEERRKENPDEYLPTDQFVTVVHNIFADGDYVAIKSHVFTSPQDPGRVFVDIWRMENGKFAEHWDVIEEINDETRPHIGCGQGGIYDEAKALGDTVANPVCGSPDPSADTEANRQLIKDYLAIGQEPGRLIEAINTYLADDFVQHAGRMPPGKQGVLDYMLPRMEERAKDKRTSHIARYMADGDFVLAHRRVTRESNPIGKAYLDIWKLRDGKVTDHWDVIQQIPEFSVSGRSMVDGPLEPGRYKGPPPKDADAAE